MTYIPRTEIRRRLVVTTRERWGAQKRIIIVDDGEGQRTHLEWCWYDALLEDSWRLCDAVHEKIDRALSYALIQALKEWPAWFCMNPPEVIRGETNGSLLGRPAKILTAELHFHTPNLGGYLNPEHHLRLCHFKVEDIKPPNEYLTTLETRHRSFTGENAWVPFSYTIKQGAYTDTLLELLVTHLGMRFDEEPHPEVDVTSDSWEINGD